MRRWHAGTWFVVAVVLIASSAVAGLPTLSEDAPTTSALGPDVQPAVADVGALLVILVDEFAIQALLPLLVAAAATEPGNGDTPPSPSESACTAQACWVGWTTGGEPLA